MSSKIEPKFYAVDALNAYPEPVGTDDKLELNQEMGAVYVHLNYKRAKLVGLQSLDFLIRILELIRVEALGPRAAPVVERKQPFAWFTEDYLTDKSSTTYDELTSARWKDKGWPVQTLFTAPPELAELQATIARLTAENERLKAKPVCVYWDEVGSTCEEPK